MQDHRIFPPELPARLSNYTFDELRLPGHGGLRVFQFHMGISRTCALQDEGKEPRFFTTTELAYNDHDDGGSVPTRVKLAAQRCIGLTIDAALTRLQNVQELQYGEYAARCAFLIDDALALRLADHERAQASFDVLVCNDTVHFPLAEVLHFPQAESLIEHGLLPRPTDGFPSAPWAGAEVQVVRASGAEAELRVAAVVFKKFSWVYDDVLWLLWMLDVVGVDHLVINVASRDLPMASVREDIAQHEGLAERVTLVDLDFPSRNTNHSYAYLVHGLSHELHLRWQVDFDFIFLIDSDEYPQLFAASDRSLTAQQGQPRIDVKTFIGHNRASLKEQGHLYFTRPFVQRSMSNNMSDPLLPPFLRELAQLDGLVTSEVWSGKSDPIEKLGKALIPVAAALRPHLHYNAHWPKRSYLDWRTGHVLHVREYRNNSALRLELQSFLTQFAQMKTK
jgi:hypothetical protein